ncbi:hypothetical protein C2E23DRAFT_872375 [Lenzites betulinus]|nr:hypothetical protein C2E23DRAFT_872375 [Lenzites betulinus]
MAQGDWPLARSSPIAIPRRKSVRPPPCSPPRDQNSPELVFDFEFSFSPKEAVSIAPRFVHNQGATTRLFPLQKGTAAYLPLSALGSGSQTPAHPYADEPFLYTVSKTPFRDTQNTRRDTLADCTTGDLNQGLRGGQFTSLGSPPAVQPVSSFECDAPSTDTALIGAFRAPLLSCSAMSSSGYWSDDDDDHVLQPSVYRPPSPYPSPPVRSRHQRMSSGARLRHLLPSRSQTIQRTAAAEPVVSLSIAQADPPLFSPQLDGGGPRARRGSATSSEHSIENVRERYRRMSTVVGRGVGRVVTRSTSGMSLVSDEDIERSLDKFDPEGVSSSRGRTLGRRHREDYFAALVDNDDNEAGPRRGRARERFPLRD